MHMTAYVQSSRLCVLLCMCRKQTTLSFSLAHWTCNFFKFYFYFTSICASLSVCAPHAHRWLWQVEEGTGSQGRNWTYSFVSHLMELLTQVLKKSKFSYLSCLCSPLYWSFLYNDKFQSILRIWSGVYFTCEAGSYYFTCVKISILLIAAPNKQLILVYIWNLLRNRRSLLRIKTSGQDFVKLGRHMYNWRVEGRIVPAHWNAKNKWTDYRFVHN